MGNKPGTPALPGGQGPLGGDLSKGSSWNSDGFQSGATDPMLLLVIETKFFIKEKKEEALLVSFIVEIGLKSLRPFI